MSALQKRDWVPQHCEDYIQTLAEKTADSDPLSIATHLDTLIARNREIHEKECFNLNPATNAMNPEG